MSVGRKGIKRISVLLCLALLTGCGSWKSEADAENDLNEAGLLEEPVLEYEIPVMLPGILLNQNGYMPSAHKIAIIRGDELPKEFRILDAQTKEVVYTGNLEHQEYDAESGEYISYGDFTAFTEEGTYLLECDILGYSYSFTITKDYYEKLMSQGLSLLAGQEAFITEDNVTEICRCISALLLSYELYGDVYDEAAKGAVPTMLLQIRAYADRLLSLQEEKTGEILVGEEIGIEQTVWLAAVLAKFSYTYQKFDSVYATVCLQAADRAWKAVQSREDVPQDVLFYASAELYRAAGQREYHTKVTKLGAELVPDAEEEALVFGALTYTATKRSVDVDLCITLMKVMMEKAEEIAQETKDGLFLVGGSLQTEDVGDLLWDTVVIASMNYIITNSEYTSVLENYQSYLAGANETAYCYIYGGEQEGIGASCVDTARYILLLSQIMSYEEEITE